MALAGEIMSFKEYYRKLSYRKKIFMGMVAVVLVSTLISLFGVLVSFNAANEKRFSDEAMDVLKNSKVMLTKSCDDIDEAIAAIAKAPATPRMILEWDKDDVYSVYRMLYSTFTDLGSYADFGIYDGAGVLKLYTGDLKYIPDTVSINWGIFYELNRSPFEKVVRNARIYNGSDKTVFLRIGRAIIDAKGNVVGYTVASVNSNQFDSIFKTLNASQFGDIFILDSFEETVYASSAIDAASLAEAKKHVLKLGEGEYYEQRDGKYRFYYIYDERDGLHIIFRQKVEPFKVMLKNLTIIVPLAALISLLLGLLISRNISSMFYRPISRMSTGMEEIKKGNFEVKIKVETDDELGRLSDNFNAMSEKLTENMNKLVDREHELSEANIKMMQAQLNPHFIYNTLDTMKWIAKDNEISEIATLSQGLADIMRASISSGQTVKLRKEIELVESYVEIQKIRFDDKFVFISDVAEELLECEVPKLMLQPIVENAILHGLKNRNFGQVLLQGYRDEAGDELIIQVKDDGQGMDQDTMEKLNNHEQLAKGTNIGFHNVDSIIKLRYGDEFGLKVVESSEKGTVVEYKLPIIKE